MIRFLMDPERARKKSRKLDETSMVFFRKLLVTVVYILGVACVLYLIPPLRTFATSILASAGIMAMAIGLASQEALSNFVSGIFIILAKPFRIGDIVTLDSGQTGKVTEIAIRHTIITTAENRQVIVPNSKINSAINYVVDYAVCESRARKPYITYEDIHGEKYIYIANEGRETDTEADYAWLNLFLRWPYPMDNTDFYVMGAANSWQFDERNLMHYDYQYGGYLCQMLLKQGYYHRRQQQQLRAVVVERQLHAEAEEVGRAQGQGRRCAERGR